MTDVPPVSNWDTDFDVLSPEYVADPFSIWDGLRGVLPGGPHRPSGEHLAPDPVPRRRRPGPRHRALQLAPDLRHPLRRGPARRARPPVRASSHLGRPAPPHLDPAAAAAVVLPPAGGRVRGDDPRSVRRHSSTASSPRAGRRRRRLRPADSGPGDRRHPRGPRVAVGHLHRVGPGHPRVRRRSRTPSAWGPEPDRVLRAGGGTAEDRAGRRPAERPAPQRVRRGRRWRRVWCSAWPPWSSSPAWTPPGAPSARRCGTWPPIPRTGIAWPRIPAPCPWPSRSCCAPTRR